MPTLYNYSLQDTLEPSLNAAKKRVTAYMKQDELGLSKYSTGAKDYPTKTADADTLVKGLSDLIDKNKSTLETVKTFLETDIANKSETEQTIAASIKRYVATLNPVKTNLKQITKTLMSPKFNEELSFSELAPVADLKNSVSELKREADKLVKTGRLFMQFVSTNITLGNTGDVKRYTLKLDFEKQKLIDEKNKLIKKLDSIINKNSKKLLATFPLPRFETDAELATRIASESASVESLLDAVESRISQNDIDIQQTLENLSTTNPFGFVTSVYPRISKIKELINVIATISDEVNSINTGMDATFANFNQTRQSIKDAPDAVGGAIMATGTMRTGMGYDFDNSYEMYRISGLPMYI